MSFFEFVYPTAQSYYEPVSSEPSLVPLFRLLDEWDRASNQQQQQQQQPKKHAHQQAATTNATAPAAAHPPKRPQQAQAQPIPAKKPFRPCHQQQQKTQTFSPRFDVYETETAYELYGELPGAARENLSIEFPDPQTITISGRVERRIQTAAAAAAAPSTEAEAEVNNNKQIEDTPMADADADANATTSEEVPSEEERPRSPYQATVEDTDDEEFETLSKISSLSSRRNSSVTKTEKAEEKNTNNKKTTTEQKGKEVENNAVVKAPQPEEKKKKESEGRFLLTERSVGEFVRSFTFPSHVNVEEVSASLRDGILSVVVPKVVPRSKVVFIQ